MSQNEAFCHTKNMSFLFSQCLQHAAASIYYIDRPYLVKILITNQKLKIYTKFKSMLVLNV